MQTGCYRALQAKEELNRSKEQARISPETSTRATRITEQMRRGLNESRQKPEPRISTDQGKARQSPRIKKVQTRKETLGTSPKLKLHPGIQRTEKSDQKKATQLLLNIAIRGQLCRATKEKQKA